ncbi:Ubiquitin-like domain-containing protein [Entamoeba marina]
MSYYIKLRRNNQTYFIVVVPSDTIAVVKQKLSIVAGCSPDYVGIYGPDNTTLMADDIQLGVGVEAGSLFYFVLKNDQGMYEPLNIINLV